VVLIARLVDRSVAVQGRIISGSVADGECIARRAALRRRKMTNDQGTQDKMNREGKTCSGGNPSPQASSMSALLQHQRTPARIPFSIMEAQTEDGLPFTAAGLIPTCDVSATEPAQRISVQEGANLEKNAFSAWAVQRPCPRLSL
jgi:hypothetical protein